MSGGTLVWFTGLPASGKSTAARAVQKALAHAGQAAVLLDGDALREALVPRPGHSPAQRDAFYETLARLSALLASQGLTVLVAATAHRRRYRTRARTLVPRFVEVWVQASPAECAARDPKGLWAAAARKEIRDFPGVDLAYEPPERADLVAEGGRDTAAVAEICARLQG